MGASRELEAAAAAAAAATLHVAPRGALGVGAKGRRITPSSFLIFDDSVCVLLQLRRALRICLRLRPALEGSQMLEPGRECRKEARFRFV